MISVDAPLVVLSVQGAVYMVTVKGRLQGALVESLVELLEVVIIRVISGQF